MCVATTQQSPTRPRLYTATGFTENQQAAQEGGEVAGNARKQLEQKTQRKVISQANYLEQEQVLEAGHE